jgi:hypothetical protein
MVGLLAIAVPFVAIGLALGYVFMPKAIDIVAALLLPAGALASGLIPVPGPSFIQDSIVLSPYYHYQESARFLAGIEHDGPPLLHLLWLAFYTVLAVTVARFAYRRDSLWR